MMLKSIFCVYLVLVFSVNLSLCQTPPKGWKGKIEIEDGVKIVVNPKEPLYKKAVSFVENLFIPESDSKQGYILVEPYKLDVDNEGNIYILDWKDINIKIFNSSGKYLRSIGKQGQGPGEFMRIHDVQAIQDQKIFASDANVARLFYFTPEGELINTKSTSAVKGFGGSTFVDSKGNYITSYGYFKNGIGADDLYKYDSELNLITKIYSVENDFNTPGSPFPLWKVSSTDMIIFAFNNDYVIKVLDPNNELKLVIKKKYEKIKIDRNEILAKFRIPLNSSIELPKYYPAFRKLWLDEEGRVIVLSYERTKDEKHCYYDVFSREGIYIARFRFNNVFRAVWKASSLYTIEEDEDGYRFVKRYKVTWNY